MKRVLALNLPALSPSNSLFSPHTANASALPDPPVGSSYADPVPLASHVIGMEALEGTEKRVSRGSLSLVHAPKPCVDLAAHPVTVTCR